MNGKQIEALVSASDNIAADIAKEAAEKNQKEARDAAVARAQRAISEGRAQLNIAVTSLRVTRRQEKAQREVVERLAEGLELFEKNGDAVALGKAIYPSSSTHAENFARNYGANGTY